MVFAHEPGCPIGLLCRDGPSILEPTDAVELVGDASLGSRLLQGRVPATFDKVVRRMLRHDMNQPTQMGHSAAEPYPGGILASCAAWSSAGLLLTHAR
jgi:hypothetical protein